ncbi:hypothetical protein C8R46DRAFT_982456 [Mycena filopes]|nr:hypothetical protein C8R46DRAFT_982456 [Mycena filopes]
MLAKDWDFSIYDTTEYLHDLRTASGVGRRWRKSDRAYGPALSFQTKTLLGEGNQAYVDGDLPGAIRIMLEVIRIEPRAASAWSVLAQCYEDQKELSKALQLRIMGAHLKHDAELWDSLARQSRELGYPQQALYCWAKAYNIDPTNVAALWDRAMLAKELGDLNTTRLAFLGILERFPHDLNILSELRTVLVDLGDLDTCASLFQAAFDHYQAAFPSGSGRAAATGQDAPGAGFALLEVLVLADLYNTLGEHERAVDVIRKGARWLQGRAAQAHWDMCEDDREFDCEIADVARAVDATDDVEPGYHELDVNARHRLAVARIKMGEIEEGKIHAEIVLSQDILDYAPLFCEIADAYFELDLFVEARAIYELLGAHDTTSSVYVLMQTAACLRNTDELQDAADVYEAVRKVDPTHNEAKMKLAEVYEILDQPRKALELVYEVIDARRRRPKEATAAVADDIAPAVPALINDKPVKPRARQPKKASTNRLSNAELRELEAKKEAEVTAGYRRLKELWPRMLQGEGEPRQEWMIEADKLVEAFRETRRLFSTSRTFKGMFPVRRTGVKTEEGEEDRILSRLQIDLAHDTTARKTRSGDQYNRVDVFRGVNFDDWLRLFIQYSFVLTQQGNYDLADEILRHLLASSAYQLPDIQDAIRIALMTCASNAGRFHVVVEQARKLLAGHQFHNEPLRIMVAALGSGLGPSDAFLATTFQKYLHREVKMFNTAVNNPEALVWSVQGRRFSTKAVAGAQDWGDDEELDGEDEKKRDGRKTKRPPRLPDIAKTPNPVVLALYGQVCLVAKSFQSATFYLLMAHDHCPEDPMISICITISSLGRAAQRQCDNRHHLITQAMAFLARYRAYRALSGDHTVEIEYNMGRTFHQLALYSHAARHYERALDVAAKSTKPVDITCAAEAAYNLSMIYVATGARTLAVQVYRRWLSF